MEFSLILTYKYKTNRNPNLSKTKLPFFFSFTVFIVLILLPLNSTLQFLHSLLLFSAKHITFASPKIIQSFSLPLLLQNLCPFHIFFSPSLKLVNSVRSTGGEDIFSGDNETINKASAAIS